MKQISPKSHGRIGLYALLLLAVIALMWMLRTCSSPRVHIGKEWRASGGDTIDVAIEYSPMSVYMYGDTLGGFNYDVLRAIARINGLTFNFRPMVSLAESLDLMERELVDIVVADVPMTLDYQERFTFTVPILLDKQVLVQRRDSTGNVDVVSQLDLANKQVWVVADSPVASRLRNLSAEIGDTIYVVQDSVYGAEQLFLLTVVGEIPRAVINEKVAASMCRDYPDMDMSTAISFTQFQSWMLRKGDTVLADSLNSMISRFKASPEYDEIVSRYIR